jgi:YD repeat-containing protein
VGFNVCQLGDEIDVLFNNGFQNGSGNEPVLLVFYKDKGQYLQYVTEFDAYYMTSAAPGTIVKFIVDIDDYSEELLAIRSFDPSAFTSGTLASRVATIHNISVWGGVFSHSATAYEITMTYTKLGELFTEVDNLNAKKTYAYDFLGNMTSATESNTQAIDVISKSWQYDLVGNMAKSIDENGVATSYIYDSLGRTTSSSIAVTNSAGVTTTQTSSYQL